MNAMLHILPFLALIAFQSIEVTAQAALGLGKYPALESGGFINGFDLTYTARVNDVEQWKISTATGGGCTLDDIAADTCGLPVLQWEDGKVPMIDIVAQLPPASELAVSGGSPSVIQAYMCFSPPSAKNKKWRKINDTLKKDNSCKLSTVLQDTEEKVPYPAAGSPALDLGTLKVPSKTPTAFFTIRAAVTCADGETMPGKNEFCHMVNRQPLKDKTTGTQVSSGEIYFPTKVMDSRPDRLYIAVFICAFIGPVIFLAFMIYERGFLAKQA